jgi:uncharacterized Zn-finger protein
MVPIIRRGEKPFSEIEATTMLGIPDYRCEKWNKKNHNKVFIGMDISSGEDQSAVCGFCGKCKTMVFSKLIDPGKQIETPYYDKCPHCGTVFKEYIMS